MAVGIMRVAFAAALEYCNPHDAGGSVVMLERPSVADLLIDMKVRAEAGRALVWWAAHAVEHQRGGGEELAYAAQIWCSEAAIMSVAGTMRAVEVYVSFWSPFASRFFCLCLFVAGLDADYQSIPRRTRRNTRSKSC